MKTVFVIGAGASKEIGMPTGYELKEDISKRLKVVTTDEHSHSYDCRTEDETINTALQCLMNSEESFSQGNYFQAADTISSGLPFEISIDNFLDKHRDNAAIVSCGKLAITRAILDAEHESYLYFEPDRDSYNVKQVINADKVQKTWYIPCFQKITENCLLENIPKRLQDMTFVIFNYDRCFEQFFWYALMKDYAIDEKEARKIVAQMHIIHPYGSVGPFIIDSFGETPPYPYHGLITLSKNIKTFTENTAQSGDDYTKMTNACTEADKIIFLGFAYHQQNLDLLFPYKRNERTKIYGTGYGISPYDISAVKGLLFHNRDHPEKISPYDIPAVKGLVKQSALNCEIVNSTCAEFFKNFQYTVTFNR